MSDFVPQIKQLLSDLFNVDLSTLSGDTMAGGIEGWDSMGQLMVIVELEQRFGVQIPPEAAENLTSVARIDEFLRSAGASTG